MDKYSRYAEGKVDERFQEPSGKHTERIHFRAGPR
jgi:hypothetical protein